MLKTLLQTLFGKVVGLFQSSARLWIEYGLIAVVITFGAVGGVLWLENKQAKHEIGQLQNEVGTVKAVNEIQQSSIDTLKEQRQRDGDAIASLQVTKDKVEMDLSKQKLKVMKLERNDVKTQEYLRKPIPPKLKCVLNKTCDPDKVDSSGNGQAELRAIQSLREREAEARISRNN